MDRFEASNGFLFQEREKLVGPGVATLQHIKSGFTDSVQTVTEGGGSAGAEWKESFPHTIIWKLPVSLDEGGGDLIDEIDEVLFADLTKLIDRAGKGELIDSVRLFGEAIQSAQESQALNKRLEELAAEGPIIPPEWLDCGEADEEEVPYVQRDYDAEIMELEAKKKKAEQQLAELNEFEIPFKINDKDNPGDPIFVYLGVALDEEGKVSCFVRIISKKGKITSEQEEWLKNEIEGSMSDGFGEDLQFRSSQRNKQIYINISEDIDQWREI